MNYNKPELISALAAEYVLGTLKGKARDRFETLKMQHTQIAQSVEYWESQLNNLATFLAPHDPNDRVWQNIKSRIGLEMQDVAHVKHDVVNISESKQASSDRNTDTARSSAPWQWISGLAVAASLVLAVLLVRSIPEVIEPVQSIAVFNNESAQALWSIDITASSIFVKTTQRVPKLPANDYQLWIVPKGGAAPISLGLISQLAETVLAKPDVFDTVEIAALAVSKEPLGGSPNGSPTEVLYATEIAIL